MRSATEPFFAVSYEVVWKISEQYTSLEQQRKLADVPVCLCLPGPRLIGSGVVWFAADRIWPDM